MMKSFADLGLCEPILKAVAEKGYNTPSPIQEKAIPAVLDNVDVMAAAQTGTGKTAGFTLPILHKLALGNKAKPNCVRALILTPTRELAAQISENVETYSKYLPLKSTVVFGGVKINPQMQKLRQGVDVLVATPGRLLDLFSQNAIKFNQLEILVLDEADRMLDMGFIHDIKRILAVLPAKRQNLMFSATFSSDIRALAKKLVNNPVEISVSAPNSAVRAVKQSLYAVDKGQKAALLIHLIKEHNWFQVLVFTRTKHGANKLTKQLEASKISAAAIHGNKSQGARTKALAGFKESKIQVLVATDIAARGIDIDQLPQVVNFDLPNVSEDYVHRIGRTGRAGAEGEAVSLVSADEFKQLKDIERLIKEVIERKEVPGFAALSKLPTTQLDTRPFKPKKPKKNIAGAANDKDGAKPANSRRTVQNKGNSANRSERPAQGRSANTAAKPVANRTAVPRKRASSAAS